MDPGFQGTPIFWDNIFAAAQTNKNRANQTTPHLELGLTKNLLEISSTQKTEIKGSRAQVKRKEHKVLFFIKNGLYGDHCQQFALRLMLLNVLLFPNREVERC